MSEKANEHEGAEGARLKAAGHTPGPWTAERQDEESGEIYWAIHARQGYEFITNVHDNPANARLVAAAPELLQALKMLEGHFVFARAHWPVGSIARMNADSALLEARQIISKATGESA